MKKETIRKVKEALCYNNEYYCVAGKIAEDESRKLIEIVRKDTLKEAIEIISLKFDKSGYYDSDSYHAAISDAILILKNMRHLSTI